MYPSENSNLIAPPHLCGIALVVVSAVIILFSFKTGQMFSRLTSELTDVLYLIISYKVCALWKKHLRGSRSTKHSLFIVTTDDIAEKVVANIQKHNYSYFDITGIAVLNADRIGCNLNGISAAANADSIVDYICQHWVDEILIVISKEFSYPAELIDKLVETGIVVIFNLQKSKIYQEENNW